MQDNSTREETPRDIVGPAIPTELTSSTRLTELASNWAKHPALKLAMGMGDYPTASRIYLIGRTLDALLALLQEQLRVPGNPSASEIADEHALVSLIEASELSGYSSRQLSRLIHQGAILNYGTKHRPKVAVGDLPRKVGMARSR